MISEPRRISIFDSTLRDGEQAPGNAMSPQQKLALALAIEELGVDTIEAGFPSSSPNDFEATRLISRALTTAKFATLNRATFADIDAAAEAGGVHNHQLQIMATGSDVHLEHKRGITREDGLREIVASVRHARELGFTDIALGVEDASRGVDDLLRPLVEASVSHGAHTVVLADTTGCVVPEEFADLVARICSWLPSGIVVSVHCHHDLGFSLANALAAVAAGADEVQVTVGGIGERAGNTALEELAAVLAYKGDRYGAMTPLDTTRSYQVFQLLCSTIMLTPPRNKPIFGANAFATEAGIHQAGMLRNPVTYEYVEPGRFGRERVILVGRHSGRNIVRHLLGELGKADDVTLVEDLYQRLVLNQAADTSVHLDDLRQNVRAHVENLLATR
jgi:2-isopropylmalate synthase